ncbi:hypothetical protein GCM10023205_22520 [Yinghuangia aomiensis]|uniref:Transposase IS4-like domain-containing protein n=1 Tax=Yinghuangia aomiensis TaxID=676205 RepID=A0ABP9H3K2_9ACTN
METCCSRPHSGYTTSCATAPAAVTDAQSVKTPRNVDETDHGIDAAEKIKGRQWHIVTDTLGLLLVALGTAASVHDSAGGRQLLDQLSASHSSVAQVSVDGGHSNFAINHGARLRIDVEVVKRTSPTRFTPLPKQWVVDCAFGGLTQNRRLARDYEALPRDPAR